MQPKCRRTPARFSAGRGLVLMLLSALFFGPSLVQGAIYSFKFDAVTSNLEEDYLAGESQLRMDVESVAGDPGAASFRFYLMGDTHMSITRIYFDDGTLLGIASIEDSDGPDEANVAFVEADMKKKTCVQIPGFDATAEFGAASEPPREPKGVNPGEWVRIIFDLQENKTIEDVVAALVGGYELRVALRVQGFSSEGSEVFVNQRAIVPAPSTLAVMLGVGGIGLAVAGFRRWRRAPA